MEFGQLHLAREEAFNIIRNYPFDYLIGSVHKIENVDVSKMDYTDVTVPQTQKATTATLLNSPPTANMTVWAISI